MDVRMLDALLARADVAVVEFGVHWKRADAEHRARAVELALDRVAEFNAASAGRGVALIRETLPQHFATADGSGDYEARIRPARGERPRCAALAPQRANRESRGWRNAQLWSAAEERGMTAWIVPQFRVMADRFDVHRDANDCTHLCYHPYVYEGVLDALFVAVHNGLVRGEALGGDRGTAVTARSASAKEETS
jgi:hypothetical protein